MDLSKLTRQAKKVVDKRGGMQSVIADAKELKNITGRHETLREKAKAAAAAIKDPGAADASHAPEREPEPTAPPNAAAAQHEPAPSNAAAEPAEPAPTTPRPAPGASDQPS